MIDPSQAPQRNTPEQNEEIIRRLMERMMGEANKFADMVYRNQTSKLSGHKDHPDVAEPWDLDA